VSVLSNVGTGVGVEPALAEDAMQGGPAEAAGEQVIKDFVPRRCREGAPWGIENDALDEAPVVEGQPVIPAANPEGEEVDRLLQVLHVPEVVLERDDVRVLQHLAPVVAELLGRPGADGALLRPDLLELLARDVVADEGGEELRGAALEAPGVVVDA